MSSFNPSQYSELSESSIDVSSEIVEKGHKNNVKVDMEKFEEMCKSFIEKKDLKIKNLVGEDKKNFDLVVNYVHMLYGTAFYKKLFEKVRKTFGFSPGPSKPGTVGSYFSGCINAMDKDNNMLPGCTVACAGSMPLPEDEHGWDFCDKAVIIGEKSEGGYVFSIVKPAERDEDYDPCYVFVEAEFSGLSPDEKRDLTHLGCKSVKLISYNGEDYKEIYEGERLVSEIDERVEKNKSTETRDVNREDRKRKNKNHSNNKNDEYSKFWIFLIFFILIILLFFLFYRYYKMKYVN